MLLQTVLKYYSFLAVANLPFLAVYKFIGTYTSLFVLVAYISTSINDGPGCLSLRCPDPSCGAAIAQDMIDFLASNEDKKKYNRYLLRSYIEDNRKVCISKHLFD